MLLDTRAGSGSAPNRTAAAKGTEGPWRGAQETWDHVRGTLLCVVTPPKPHPLTEQSSSPRTRRPRSLSLCVLMFPIFFFNSITSIIERKKKPKVNETKQVLCSGTMYFECR